MVKINKVLFLIEIIGKQLLMIKFKIDRRQNFFESCEDVQNLFVILNGQLVLVEFMIKILEVIVFSLNLE